VRLLIHISTLSRFIYNPVRSHHACATDLLYLSLYYIAIPLVALTLSYCSRGYNRLLRRELLSRSLGRILNSVQLPESINTTYVLSLIHNYLLV